MANQGAVIDAFRTNEKTRRSSRNGGSGEDPRLLFFRSTSV
jgi:hypothetical protein